MAEIVCPCGAVLRARTGAELLGVLEAHLPGHERDVGDFPELTAVEPPDARLVLEKLTETERRIVDEAVHGRTNREIADRLHISPKTVE